MNIINKIIKNKFFEPSIRIFVCYLISMYLSVYIVMPFIGFFGLFSIILKLETEKALLISGLPACLSTAYFILKICGIFKIIKDKDIFKEILKYILFVMIIIALMQMNFLIFMDDLKKMNHFEGVSFVVFDAVFVYPMYKFFEFLTKKFEFFQKFGYFVSYRFYRDMFLKLKNKLSKK